jgi:hypothetical protein
MKDILNALGRAVLALALAWVLAWWMTREQAPKPATAASDPVAGLLEDLYTEARDITRKAAP